MGREWDSFRTDDAGTTRHRGDNAGAQGVIRPHEAPPAMLAFGEWCRQWAAECLRVLKPGGHVLAFGGSRTYHRLACGLEDAGFEIRDSIVWLYATGFPKGLDVAKGIDKAAGVWRGQAGEVTTGNESMSGGNYERTDKGEPVTGDAVRWAGWNTALKPAQEPIVLARKPLEGSVVASVLKYGTGALNVDGCRIPMSGEDRTKFERGAEAWRDMSVRRTGGEHKATEVYGVYGIESAGVHDGGRWPPNVVLSHAAVPGGVSLCDEESGRCVDGCAVEAMNRAGEDVSRYFPAFYYQRKADGRERPRVDGVAHATVKPLALMRWLVRLVVPRGATVLEPFAGSGTTVEACIREGVNCVAVERGAEYLPLIEERIRRATAPWKPPADARRNPVAPLTLFDDMED